MAKRPRKKKKPIDQCGESDRRRRQRQRQQRIGFMKTVAKEQLANMIPKSCHEMTPALRQTATTANRSGIQGDFGSDGRKVHVQRSPRAWSKAASRQRKYA